MGVTIPKHSLLSGKASYQNGRVHISGREISLNGIVIPLSFEVYDQSQVKGLIYKDQKLARDVKRRAAQEGTNQIRQNIPTTTIPFVDVGIRAASEGIRELVGANKQHEFTFSAHFPILINIY